MRNCSNVHHRTLPCICGTVSWEDQHRTWNVSRLSSSCTIFCTLVGPGIQTITTKVIVVHFRITMSAGGSIYINLHRPIDTHTCKRSTLCHHHQHLPQTKQTIQLSSAVHRKALCPCTALATPLGRVGRKHETMAKQMWNFWNRLNCYSTSHDWHPYHNNNHHGGVSVVAMITRPVVNCFFNTGYAK